MKIAVLGYAGSGKTYLSDFIEKYPKSQFSADRTPPACAAQLGYIKVCPQPTKTCADCWNTPMEDDE